MNINFDLISSCLKYSVNNQNICYVRETDIPVECLLEDKIYIRSIIEKYKQNTIRYTPPTYPYVQSFSTPHQSIIPNNDFQLNNISMMMQQPTPMQMSNVTMCDVKQCIKTATSVCEICCNPICLSHQNIRKDYTYSYTRYSSSVIVDKQGLCPDCDFVARLKIGLTNKHPPCWCCVSQAKYLTCCILITVTLGIVLFTCGNYIPSGTYLGYLALIAYIVLPFTGGLCLICGILNLYFNYIIKIRNAEVDKRDEYVIVMKRTNGYCHGIFTEDKITRNCCIGTVKGTK